MNTRFMELSTDQDERLRQFGRLDWDSCKRLWFDRQGNVVQFVRPLALVKQDVLAR